MDQKEQNLRAELLELDAKLQDPLIYNDKNYPKLAKRRSELDEIIDLFNEKAKLVSAEAAAKELLHSPDSEMQLMASTELDELVAKISANENRLIEALTPQ